MREGRREDMMVTESRRKKLRQEMKNVTGKEGKGEVEREMGQGRKEKREGKEGDGKAGGKLTARKTHTC